MLLTPASRFLARNARMVGVGAVATRAEIYGAILLAAGFLATNARMVGVGAVATRAKIYGALLLAAGFLATNARMGLVVLVAPKTFHSCIRGYPLQRISNNHQL
ncbi:MAG: hypothetical protein FJZ75_08355 [Bacteroidetes bacterium]|nr:hypothetical protein [Bacteroidota bacterium]